ncbi:MAG: hypothetical protein RL701_2589 [Pseudomonadota bacterium]
MRALAGSWLIICVLSSCASSGFKMNPSLPIEKHTTFAGGTGYRQNGQTLDGSSMLKTLEQEPAARDDVMSGRIAWYVATALSAIGGALLGYEIGMAAGQQDVNWVITGAGGALAGVGISLGVVAGWDIEDAVDTHNGFTSAGHARAGSPSGN